MHVPLYSWYRLDWFIMVVSFTLRMPLSEMYKVIRTFFSLFLLLSDNIYLSVSVNVCSIYILEFPNSKNEYVGEILYQFSVYKYSHLKQHKLFPLCISYKLGIIIVDNTLKFCPIWGFDNTNSELNYKKYQKQIFLFFLVHFQVGHCVQLRLLQNLTDGVKMVQ